MLVYIILISKSGLGFMPNAQNFIIQSRNVEIAVQDARFMSWTNVPSDISTVSILFPVVFNYVTQPKSMCHHFIILPQYK